MFYVCVCVCESKNHHGKKDDDEESIEYQQVHHVAARVTSRQHSYTHLGVINIWGNVLNMKNKHTTSWRISYYTVCLARLVEFKIEL